MNKILKSIDNKLFILCISITIMIFVHTTKTPITENNIELSPSIAFIYSLDNRIMWIFAESVVIFLILSVIFFTLYKLNNKNKKNTTELQNNLKQHLNKLERLNKELIETKEELNQQQEFLRLNEEKLIKIEEKYSLVFETAMISIFEWDINENIIIISRWFKDILGLKNNVITTKEFLELMQEADKERHISYLYEYIERKKEFFNIKEKYKLKDNSFEWFEINAKGVFSDDGLMIKLCGVIKNVNKQELSNENMEKLAYTDYLTELPNKIAIDKIFTQILNSKNYNKLYVFLLDIDDLGIVNNEFGTIVGDEVLKIVSNRIKSLLHENSYLARLSGDKFLILELNLESIDNAHKKALSIIKEFEEPFIVNDNTYYITASIGISIAPDDGLDVDFLIKNATEAMYKAKNSGKNTYRFYTQNLNKEILKKINMINDIKLGVERDEFFLVYQPQYNINTNKIIGFESFIRWKQKSKGVIYPIDFMSIAEESGLIVSIGQKVLIKACKQARDWKDNGFNNIIISVNISTRQFNDKNFCNLLKDIHNLEIVKSEQINFEINEDIILHDTTQAINAINKIKELGFSFSIHKAGNNLMSIITIKDLPISSIKLEKNFIIEQLRTEEGKELMKASIKLAHSKKFKIIPERIESEEEVEFFKSNNCDILQGNYFSKPLTDTQADKLLAKQFFI